MASLPSNVGYGKVVGRFIKAVGDNGAGDSDVDDKPDAVPVEGYVTFTPSAAWLLNAAASPDPVTIIPQPVICTLDANGYLLDPAGATGVWLVATDDPQNNPTGWTYDVSLNFSGLGVRNFSIAVPEGATVNLANVTPVASSGGTLITTGPQGAQGLPGDMAPADSNTWTGSIDTSVHTPPATKIRTLTGNTTITVLPSAPAAGYSSTITYVIKQAPSGGPYTLAWPATLEWPSDAAAPVMPTVANAEMIVHLFWTGTAWRALVGGVYYP